MSAMRGKWGYEDEVEGLLQRQVEEETLRSEEGDEQNREIEKRSLILDYNKPRMATLMGLV